MITKKTVKSTKKSGDVTTTKRAKRIIRSEIKSYLGSIDTVKKDICLSNFQSNYRKGASLVDTGAFANDYDKKRKMLGKIYGKENVKNWYDNRIHVVYRHLIGREYEAMLREKAKKKPKK